MKSAFLNLSKGKNLLFLGCLFLLFNLLMSHFMPKEHALDLKFAYSVEDAYLSLGSLDLESRQNYRWGIWLLDMPYMVVYSLLFSGVLLRLWRNRKLIIFPVGIFLLDFFENLLILRMLRIFPAGNDFLATFSSVFTTCKWLLIVAMLCIVGVGILNFLFSPKYSSLKSPETEI